MNADEIKALAAAIVVPAWGHKRCGRCLHERWQHDDRQGWLTTQTMMGRCGVVGCDCGEYDYVGQT